MEKFWKLFCKTKIGERTTVFGIPVSHFVTAYGQVRVDITDKSIEMSPLFLLNDKNELV